MTREEMRAHAKTVQSDWPPLTARQIEALRALLLRPQAEREAS